MDEEFNQLFIDLIADNDRSELSPENQPKFYDINIQSVPDMTIIPIGYIPNIGTIELIIKMKDYLWLKM